MTRPLEPARPADWIQVIRRARLLPSEKLTALILASYADPDGSNAYPGLVRLTVQTRLGYRTVQRAVARLRQLGAIEPQQQRIRRHWRTCYRLTLSDHLADVVPTPAAEDAEIEAMTQQLRQQKRSSYRARHAINQTPLNGVRSGNQTPHSGTDQTPPPHRPPAAMTPRPIPVPDLATATTHTEVDVAAPGTGMRGSMNGRNPGFDVSTRRGTDAERRRQDDALRQWQAQHPEAAS